MSVCVTGPETDVVFTVAHEARHLWQYAHGWPGRGRLDGTGSPEDTARTVAHELRHLRRRRSSP